MFRKTTLPLSQKSPNNDPSDGPDHSVSRDGIVESIEKFSKVIHLAGRPLPSSTGDGSYIVDTKPTGGLLEDLKNLRAKDYATLHMLLKKELSKDHLTDDKTMVMERVIQLVSNLPQNSEHRVTLTNVFVGELWDSLQHPPQSMLGDKYTYRQADGSWNNILNADIGRAGTPYARSVAPHVVQPNPKPDPGLIFDSIMSRENGGFKPHANKISSMLYYIASIIIHDCFRTSHEDFNISQTSSYLDLSPLYGSNQDEQNLVRTFQDGRLKPDCFSEKRLLGFPPGVGCILIMFNRFHNFVVKQLADINENDRFKKPRDGLPADKAAAVEKKYDEDLFQTARLITCGLYINIILLDYLRTIVGLNRVDSTWTLDPRVDMEGGPGKTRSPRGTGNQCSVEFNLVYRWHSCISQRDEKWSQDLYRKLFGKDHKEVSLKELLVALGQLEAKMPENPPDRDFGGLKRNADGTYNDDDLVSILADSVEDLAGSSGANNIPEVLRAVEILGMEQARSWKCATLNEFRKHFGLTPYETFEDITSDKEVAKSMKALYDHPDFVELYAGLVCEDAKAPMDPGVGIGPTYTISRSILSDAVTLVRGDRFYTTDYHPGNLTNWGFQEAQYDLSINHGCVFYKLFMRAFPNHFEFNNIYAHYPLVIPSENKNIMTKLNRVDEFSWNRPTRIPQRINVVSYNAVTTILKNGEVFGVDPWRRGLYYLMGKPGADFMLAGDGPFFAERREQMRQCLYQANWHKSVKDFYEAITLKLLKKWSHEIGGKTKQVDIIRDVGNSAHVYFAANIFSLPLKSDAHPKGVFTEHELYMILAVIFVVVFFGDVDKAKTFPLRTAALPLTQALGALVEQNVSIISKTGLISGLIDPLFMEEQNALKDYGVHMIRHLLKGGLGVHETTWSQILPTAGAMVANQGQVFGQIIDFYTTTGKEHLPEINRLAKLNTDAADEILLHYVMEAIRKYRLNGTFGAFRKCHKDITIDDGDGKRTFKAGDLVFVGFVEIARDPKVYPHPEKVLLDRPIESYLVYGIGPHSCLGGAASRAALTAMLKVVGRLDNFRATPGPQGKMKKITRDGGFYVYMDALQGQYFPFPTTMKVQWDGGWNEPVKNI
ncbi:heme peroxidase [Amylocarpus encephaloides]|uniref:Heme peroxidase n=1 Tax=Amylocarpus encephaloides TaxID=45428 RepID=A0A9P7YK97_9HELO|nr:heme peroxidase [Amylocarpus encephaloides]